MSEYYCGGGPSDPINNIHQPHEIPGTLGGWCDGRPKTTEERIRQLEEHVVRLEDRFNSMLEVNGLWDGS